MKNIHAIFLACAVVATSSFVDEAQAQIAGPAVANAVAKVQLSCSYGSSDVARVYRVKNNTGKVILKGSKIVAESTLNGAYPNDKRTATITLPNDVNPFQTIEMPKPGQTNAGSCKAWIQYGGKPDLILTKVEWTKFRVTRNGPLVDAVRVVVKNRNPFASAGTSKTRVQSMNCSQAAVTTLMVDTPAIPGGASRTVVRPLSRQYPAAYLNAYANATNTVPETIKTNNHWAGDMGVCIK